MTISFAGAATVRVTSDAELTAALALVLPGDVIQLAPGAYGTVSIAARGGADADLTLAGEPGATIAGMTITGSTRLVVTGLAVVPAGATAYITVASSSGVTFSNLHLDGGAGGAGAAIWLAPDALGVVIENSTTARWVAAEQRARAQQHRDLGPLELVLAADAVALP